MRYKEFGNTGWKVSALSIGTWTYGGKAFKGIDDKDAIRAIHALVDSGVNHIDTAPAYSDGASEIVVGKAVSGIRDKVYITTKCGLRSDAEGGGRDSSPAYIEKSCDLSLKRLGIDYIDNYVIHWPDHNTPIEDTMDCLYRLKKAGKIRAIGLSNFNSEEMEHVFSCGPIDTYQMGYSMVSRGEEENFKTAKTKGMGTMSYSSLAAGILTGIYRTLPKFDEGDVRATLYDYFKEPTFSKVMELLKVMDIISENRGGVPLAQIAINWSTQKDFIDTALCGAANEREATENCKTFDWELTQEEINLLDKTIESVLGNHTKIFGVEA